MPTPRSARTFLARLLLATAVWLPLHAQVAVDFTWIGTTADMTLDANWSGSNNDHPNPSSSYPPVIDSLIFGDSANFNLDFPALIAMDVTFNASETDYTFDGDLALARDLLITTPGRNVTFTSDADINLSNNPHTLSLAAGSELTIDGTFSVGTNFTNASVTQEGSGTLTLNGANAFLGGLFVDGGTLVIGNSSASGYVVEGTGGHFNITSSPVGFGTLHLAADTALTFATGQSITLYNDTQLGSAGGVVNLVTPESSSLSLFGQIGGTAGLSKTGAGTLLLGQPDNSFSGGLSIHEGSLVLVISSQLIGSDIVGPVGSGWLKLYGGTSLGIAPNGVATPHWTLHNPISLDCNGESGVEITIGTGTSLTLLGNIDGAAELNKTGSGTLTLSGNNIFTGDFYVSGGTVNVGSNTGTGAGALELGTSPNITVNFQTALPVVHGLSGDDSLQSVTLANGASFTLDQSDREEAFDFQGQLSGTGVTVKKTGGGTQVFSGANPYSGTTLIQDGVLVANHADSVTHVVDALGSSTVTLDGGILRIGDGMTFNNVLNFGTNGGTLAGNATFTSPLTFGANVVLSPGNSPGTLTFAAGLAANNGLSTDIEINGVANDPGVTSDLIVTSGSGLNLSAVSAGQYTLRIISLDLVNAPGSVDGLTGPASWTIFQNSALSGFVADGSQFSFDTSEFVGGGIFSLSQSGTNLVLNFTPVPEPSTYALLSLGAGLTGLAAWRKRRLARRSLGEDGRA